MWRRTAGIWGPVGFSIAAITAARRQDGYSHLDNHVSGLASQRQSSAAVMVPGFLLLAASQAALRAPSSRLQRMLRAASLTTAGAGLARVSRPDCPRPGVDDGATRADIAHAVASVTTFLIWSALPIVAVRDVDGPVWYRRFARGMLVPTSATLLLAAATTNLGTRYKGLAQRAFLGTVFVFLAATGFADGREVSSPWPVTGS